MQSKVLAHLRGEGWRSPLNALRLMSVMSVLAVAVAFLFPGVQRFVVGFVFSMGGVLMTQLFRARSIQLEDTSARSNMTTLGLDAR